MSASKVSEIAQSLQPIREAWQERPLKNEYATVMIDALRLNVRRDDVYLEACFLVLGTKPDGKREILGMYLFAEEGAHAWKEVFGDLRMRGLTDIPLIISDELTGIIDAVSECYPKARHQICLVHRKRNLMIYVRSDRKAEFNADFNDVFQIDAFENSEKHIAKRRPGFIAKWKRHIPNLETKLEAEKIRYYGAFLSFPREVRRMVYSTNWIERLNCQIRKVTKRVPSFPNPDSLFNLVFMAMQPFEDGCYKRQIPAFREYVMPLFPQLINANPDTQV